MKKRVILLLIILSLVFGIGITYSMYTSNTNLNINDQHLAKFVFNTEKKDNLELPINDLIPGEDTSYSFSVTNNDLDNQSDVTLTYQLIISTYHIMPLDIKLYRVNGKNEEYVMSCDNSYSRDSTNKLICKSDEFEMRYNENNNEEYKLKISFMDGYDGSEYSELVDFVDLEIKSYQKI